MSSEASYPVKNFSTNYTSKKHKTSIISASMPYNFSAESHAVF